MKPEQATLSFEELGYVMTESGYAKRKVPSRKLWFLVLACILAASALGYLSLQSGADSQTKTKDTAEPIDSTLRTHNVLKRLRIYADDCDARSWKTDELALERSIVLCKDASAELELANNHATKRELRKLLLHGLLSFARQELYRSHRDRAAHLLKKARNLVNHDMEPSLEKQYYITAAGIESDKEKAEDDLANLVRFANENSESPDELCSVNIMAGAKYLELNDPDEAKSCLDTAIRIAKSTHCSKSLADALKWKLALLEKTKANASEIKLLKKECANLR